MEQPCICCDRLVRKNLEYHWLPRQPPREGTSLHRFMNRMKERLKWWHAPGTPAPPADLVEQYDVATMFRGTVDWVADYFDGLVLSPRGIHHDDADGRDDYYMRICKQCGDSLRRGVRRRGATTYDNPLAVDSDAPVGDVDGYDDPVEVNEAVPLPPRYALANGFATGELPRFRF